MSLTERNREDGSSTRTLDVQLHFFTTQLLHFLTAQPHVTQPTRNRDTARLDSLMQPLECVTFLFSHHHLPFLGKLLSGHYPLGQSHLQP